MEWPDRGQWNPGAISRSGKRTNAPVPVLRVRHHEFGCVDQLVSRHDDVEIDFPSVRCDRPDLPIRFSIVFKRFSKS